MLRLRFDFLAGRYHATPWGHHVNEGLVEWPPSPWRILRALLATGYTKLGWRQVPDDMRRLAEALSAREPTYCLPPATNSHTRHYMPVRGWKAGIQKTSMVIDAFIIPAGPLGVEWPAVLRPSERELLSHLLSRLSYLGRAESRVAARLASEVEHLPDSIVSTTACTGDDEPVRLLAPLSVHAYAVWRRGMPSAPDDLVAALHADTNQLQRDGWSSPPGTREIVYWRRQMDGAQVRGRANLDSVEHSGSDTALFALSTDKKTDVLPLVERTLPTMATFRRALLSKVGDAQMVGGCSELTGKDVEGRPLKFAHLHAHFIPLSIGAKTPMRIDHVLVHASMGFGRIAETALRRLRKTWATGMDDITVNLVGLGRRDAFQLTGEWEIPELATSTTWVSRTPFIPPRFIKATGKDSLENQVRAELESRRLPGLAAPPVVALPSVGGDAGKRAREFRLFTRTRSKGTVPPPGAFHLSLTLEEEVRGPLCLGWGCHFGLGLFAPAEGALMAQSPR